MISASQFGQFAHLLSVHSSVVLLQAPGGQQMIQNRKENWTSLYLDSHKDSSHCRDTYKGKLLLALMTAVKHLLFAGN